MDQNQNLNVLIVERSKSNFNKLKHHLDSISDFNLKLFPAYSQEEAISIFHREAMDVCFLCTELTNGIGEDFLGQLQKKIRHTAIILICNDFPNEEFWEKENINEYVLRKNFSTSVLSNAIRHAIEHNDINLQLKAQEEKYSKLFYSSLEATFTINEHFKVLECNQSFRELFGIKNLEEFDFKDVFKNESEEEIFEHLSSPKERRAKKVKITNSKGDDIIAYLSLSPVRAEIDETEFIGVIHDVTDLEKAQLKLAENDKLQMIHRMARIIGHEIRNPLTNIFLAAEELKQECEGDEDSMEMLEMIHRGSSRISSLIDNFLKNARTDEPIKEMYPIEQSVAEAIDSCSDRITLKQINFTSKGLDSETKLLIDNQKIVIAFTNILINAIEALECREDPQLCISVSTTPKHVRVAIEDNGVGMSDEMRKNLFTPFFSSKQGGLGLGMSNTFSILRAHDALVDVKSELDVGTRFIIELPM
ncbi:MAG: PAS domain-containing sensor histidine kinase [Flavobacteriales bacterium]|nr:PAS domain-containing sensor histidine kinase [Flavobacteriales bacterium]